MIEISQAIYWPSDWKDVKLQNELLGVVAVSVGVRDLMEVVQFQSFLESGFNVVCSYGGVIYNEVELWMNAFSNKRVYD